MLVDQEQIVAARIDWGDPVRSGAIMGAKLTSKTAGKRRGTARLADGTQVLVDSLPREATEGQSLLLAITRCAIAERGRGKLAQARPAPPGATERAGPSLFDALSAGSLPVCRVRPGDGSLDRLGWDELVEQAVSGHVGFTGGSLDVSPTPAMTVIDVDGMLPPAQLALAAVPALVVTLARLDIGGNIGIDFPTLEEKAQRHAVDAALAAALRHWQGERTAMNGFGFVQLVARLEQPSIAALYQRHPARAGAQTALRQAEAIAAPGTILITANPALRGEFSSERIAELTRRTGRQICLEWDPAIALGAPSVQALTP